MKIQKAISTPFAILVVGIVAIIGFSILYSYQYIWTSEEKTSLSWQETWKFAGRNLEVYRNKNYGFEFRYPEDWNYGPNILTSESTDSRLGWGIVFCPPELSDYDNSLKCKWESKDGGMPNSLAPIGLFVWKKENYPGKFITTTEKFDKEGIWEHKHNDENYVYEVQLWNDSFQDVYNKIVSTFKFIE